MSSGTHVNECPSCKSVFDYPAKPGNRDAVDLRPLIDIWPWEFHETDQFDPIRLAYRQRLIKSASTLVRQNELFPESLHVCWHCMKRGQLKEAINDITIQRMQQNNACDETLRSLKTPNFEDLSDTPSDLDIARAEDQLRSAMLEAELLDAEETALQAQLQHKVKLHREKLELTFASRSEVQRLQDELSALDVQLDQVLADLGNTPKTAHDRWMEFWKIRTITSPTWGTFGAICGIPLAVGIPEDYRQFESGTKPENATQRFSNSGVVLSRNDLSSLDRESTPPLNSTMTITPSPATSEGRNQLLGALASFAEVSSRWTADSREVQYLSSALTMLSALVGRLSALAASSSPAIMADRPYRVLTIPLQVDSRKPGATESYSLLPFSTETKQPNLDWPKALGEMSWTLSLVFKVFHGTPQYPLPTREELPNYYDLDLAQPSRWNEKMSHLLSNCNRLIALRFKPTPSLSSSTIPNSPDLDPLPQHWTSELI